MERQCDLRSLSRDLGLSPTLKASDPASAQVAYFDVLFKSVVLCFVLLNTLWTADHLKIIVGTLLITFIGVGGISLFQTLGYAIVSGERLRLMGTGAFRNSNDIAALMVLIFPFALMPLLRKGNNPVFRWIAAAALLLVGPSIWLSQSRGAMLGLAVATGIYLFLKVKNRWATVAFLFALVATAAAYSISRLARTRICRSRESAVRPISRQELPWRFIIPSWESGTTGM